MTTDQLITVQTEILDGIEFKLSYIDTALHRLEETFTRLERDITAIYDFLVPPHMRGMDQDLMPRVSYSVLRMPRTVDNPTFRSEEEKIPSPLPLRRTDGTELLPEGPPVCSDTNSFIWPAPRRVNGSWAQAFNSSSGRSPSVTPEESRALVNTTPPPGGA